MNKITKTLILILTSLCLANHKSEAAISLVSVALTAQFQTNYTTATLDVAKTFKKTIDNKILLAALAADTGISFSSKAYLGYDTVTDHFVVVDQGVTNDVSTVFYWEDHNEIEAYSYSLITGAGSETANTHETFTYNGQGLTTGLYFDVSGIVVRSTSISAPNKNGLITVDWAPMN